MVYYERANPSAVPNVNPALASEVNYADYKQPSKLPRYFSSIITSRIILNIRQYGNRNGNDRTESTSEPISQLRVASGGVTFGSSIGLGGRLYDI